MPDEEQKFGGKGGMKQSKETVEVLEDCVLGKLSLANIDSVILDLSRMGNRKGIKECSQQINCYSCFSLLKLKIICDRQNMTSIQLPS